MVCKNCGTENEQGAMFCANCGASLAEAAAPAPESTPAEPAAPAQKKSGNAPARKLIIGAAAAVIVLALLIALIASLSGGSKYPKVKDTIIPLEMNGETVFVVNNKVIKDKLDGGYRSSRTSTDGSKMAIKGDDDDYTLYFVTTKGVKEVATEVGDYMLSLEGDTIAYINDDDELHLYQTGSKKDKKIDDDVVEIYALSPDGKSVLYSVDDGDESILMVSKANGKTYEVAKGASGVALSDNGKYVYYYNY